LLLTPPLFNPNFGSVVVDQIAHVGVSPSINLKLISRESYVYYRQWSNCKIGGPGTVCALGAPVTIVGGSVTRPGALNIITALCECKIKKEDAVMLGKKVSK